MNQMPRFGFIRYVIRCVAGKGTLRQWRPWIALSFVLLGLYGAFYVFLLIQDGPPLRWVLRGRHFQRVVAHWGKQRIDSRDPQLIARFDNAIRPAFASVSYPTFNLPDPDDRKKWNVVLFDQRNQPFEVVAEIYDGGGFYAPSVGSTYTSHPYFFSVCNSVFGKPESYWPAIHSNDFK